MKRTMKRTDRHRVRIRRKNRRPNALKNGLLSPAQLTSCVESLAFGQVGCSLIRMLGIKPIELLAALQEKHSAGLRD